MVRLFLAYNEGTKLLKTEAQTLSELQADVESRLGFPVLQLCLGSAVIEDDHDVICLKDDDQLDVIRTLLMTGG